MDWDNLIVGLIVAVIGGVLAAALGGWNFYAGGVAHAAGALAALRGFVGADLDAASAGWLVLFTVMALGGATATPFGVRFLIQGDPWRPTARGRGLRRISPIRFTWGRSRLAADGARRRRDYAAYTRAPREA